jgi:branched-chain amino acid transport system ATP-binding protein
MRIEVFKKIRAIREMGITIMLIEQDVSTIFEMTTRNYVLSSGKIIAEGTGDELLQDEVLRKTYLGL